MKGYYVGALVLLLLACDGITEPLCGCSPPGGGAAVIAGVVTDPELAPVAGAVVRVRVVQNESCEEPDSTITRAAQAGADGRFRHVEDWSGGRKCFRVWAEPPQGSPLSESASQLVRIDYLDVVRPDSVELSLQLR
jgi:hypothetical protein